MNVTVVLHFVRKVVACDSITVSFAKMDTFAGFADMQVDFCAPGGYVSVDIDIWVSWCSALAHASHLQLIV